MKRGVFRREAAHMAARDSASSPAPRDANAEAREDEVELFTPRVGVWGGVHEVFFWGILNSLTVFFYSHNYT